MLTAETMSWKATSRPTHVRSHGIESIDSQGAGIHIVGSPPAGKLAGLDKKLSKSLDTEVQMESSSLEMSRSPVGPLAESSRSVCHACMGRAALPDAWHGSDHALAPAELKSDKPLTLPIPLSLSKQPEDPHLPHSHAEQHLP